MRISVHTTGKLVKALKDRENKTEVIQACERELVLVLVLQELVYAVLHCEENS